MAYSDIRVSEMLVKMDVRCLLFKLLLFQVLVAWCGAKHVTIIHTNSPTVGLHDLEDDVQNSIRNLLLTGIYSQKHLDTSQVQVTRPVKVTQDGRLVSRAVEHAHEHGHARARRDLHETEHEQPHSLHYNLTVDGRELRLDLRPSVTFITPAMIVERHRANERIRHRPRVESTSCHYTGTVRGQPGSAVAISACDGLAGHLRTAQGEYWIEPSNQIPTDKSEGRPHIIFKRSAVDKVEAFHRAKRAIENRDNKNTDNRQHYNRNNEQDSKRSVDSRRNRIIMDRNRRDFLERRRKRLEAMRRNPVEYRKQQVNLRMEDRRHSSSKSNSFEASKSFEQSFEARKRNRNRNNNKDVRLQRMKNRRRRKRSKRKNCATKQPPYQWRTKNMQDQRRFRNNQSNYQYAHHNRFNQRSQRDRPNRPTRSVSKPRHVEVLLVADKSMTDFHNQGNLETYLLTIMNMVSSLYMDPSIGNYIKVVVVKIILAEDIEAGRDLQVSTNADSTLASFCRWQQNVNPDDDANPHHHDVAILVTRQDICSQHNSPCSTLGVAHVAGMCKPDRSCSVNEDNGIMLAHTITHELGHNFGLYHDTEKIGCHRREGATVHIMTPVFDSDTVQVAWSRCSKRDVTNFLDAGLGECLSDRPSQEYAYPEVPAGVMYDAESQCHLQFGAEAVVCSDPSELCEHLWCFIEGNCRTMMRLVAPGTSCGDNMWCQNQTCVPRQASPAPIDGGWSEWSEWSECSRTCGAGVSTQSRECNNPAPNNNGAYCIGDRSRYKVCNIDPCPINEPSFREVQCSRHNNISYNNETITEWIPYFDQDKPCELQCVAKDNDLEMLGGYVSDGTPCKQNLGAKDMCIAGVCYQVGCDWVVGSNVKEDACGVCGGDGTACKTVLGSFSKDTTKQSGFDEVAVIPAGSRNVKIQEKVSPGNYISIGSARSRKMYLTGARNTTLTEYFVAGTPAIYERDRDWEKVVIPGPIAEDIKVYQRLYHGSRHRNPGVTYQYTVDANKLRQYSYRLSDWSPCSVSCGHGVMSRHLDCVNQHKRVVEQSRCYNIEPPPPEALRQRCHAPPCPPRAPPQPLPLAPAPRPYWWPGAYQPCAKNCHMPGEEVRKHRSVYCVLANVVVEESQCEAANKPQEYIECDVPAC